MDNKTNQISVLKKIILILVLCVLGPRLTCAVQPCQAADPAECIDDSLVILGTYYEDGEVDEVETHVEDRIDDRYYMLS